MKSSRAILSVRYSPAAAGVGKAVGGFLRYIHHRDHVQRGEEGRGVSGLVRYVAYRDQAAAEGRLFNRERTVGDRERKELVRYVRRSLIGIRPDTRQASMRAVYRFVLSPEDARGLDLRQLARATMAQLERDSGQPLPPWIAAVHRNTAHPHLHVVLAARREVAPGQFRGLMVTRQRLQAMKVATRLEIERQRGDRPRYRSLEARLSDLRRPVRSRGMRRSGASRQPRPGVRVAREIDTMLRRAAAEYRRQAELEAEDREWASDRDRSDERERGGLR